MTITSGQDRAITQEDTTPDNIGPDNISPDVAIDISDESQPDESMADESPAQEGGHALARPQRRLLRRIYNSRTVPIVVNDRPFLTYKEASRYLLTLTGEAREQAYLDMKNSALAKSRAPA